MQSPVTHVALAERHVTCHPFRHRLVGPSLTVVMSCTCRAGRRLYERNGEIVRQLTKFTLSSRLASAIRRSEQTLDALGQPFALPQPILSGLMHGRSFGPRVRMRVVLMAQALGVPADRATRRVSDGSR